MANATLVTQKVQEIHLINKLEKSGQIQLDSSFFLECKLCSRRQPLCGQAPADPPGQGVRQGASSP